MTALFVLALLPIQFTDDPAFPKEMQTRALEATVRIVHPTTRGDGSGVVVRYENGFAYILTAAHVVPPGLNGDDVEISLFPQGKSRADVVPIKTQVKARMPNEDLALIVLGTKSAPPGVTPLCPKDDLPPRGVQPGQPLRTLAVGISPIGSPEALADRIVGPRFIARPGITDRRLYWEADREQTLGRSGGPLYDTKGRVIGICCGVQNNKGYYISIFEIQASLRNSGFDFLTKPPPAQAPGAVP